MSVSQHELAVRQANRATSDLRKMFREVGVGAGSRSRLAIPTAYRTARAMLEDEISAQRANEAFAVIRDATSRVASDSVVRAYTAGIDYAERNLSIYGVGTLSPYTPISPHRVRDISQAVINAVDNQLANIRVAIATGNVLRVLGDGGRVGLLRPDIITRAVANMIAATHNQGFDVRASEVSDQLELVRGGIRLKKQAIATIDERVTDCCLRVHGQVVEVYKPFDLVGTPRYADQIEHPPFHDFCRTATALLQVEDENDSVTQAMREAARRELEAIQKYGRPKVPIYPANAFSGR